MSANQGIKVVFFGTPLFSAVILKALAESPYKPMLVVTAPDQPVGRSALLTPPPVKILAEKHGIEILQPKKLDASFTLHPPAGGPSLKPDLIIVAAYGKILPKTILDTPRRGSLNVHPSLLPQLRGPSPIQGAILQGLPETGVTIMLMDEEMDHGSVLTKKEFQILNFKFKNGLGKPAYEELHEKLAQIGAKLLLETIPLWLAGNLAPQEQNHKNATYTHIIKKEDGHIDWNRPAEIIEREIRAYDPWPGTYTFFQDAKNNKKRLKIFSAVVRSAENKNTPGTLTTEKEEPAIFAGEGKLILQSVQVEGKPRTSGKDFLRGYSFLVGQKLE